MKYARIWRLSWLALLCVSLCFGVRSAQADDNDSSGDPDPQEQQEEVEASVTFDDATILEEEVKKGPKTKKVTVVQEVVDARSNGTPIMVFIYSSDEKKGKATAAMRALFADASALPELSGIQKIQLDSASPEGAKAMKVLKGSAVCLLLFDSKGKLTKKLTSPPKPAVLNNLAKKLKG
ncbi:hypothetical protein ACFL59_11380 [Planctomycetota bacterium]